MRSKYSRYNFVSVSEEVKQGVPSTLQQECECAVCFRNYNLDDRVPMNICEAQHHCCLECLDCLLKTRNQCPFCKKLIESKLIQKNRIISKIIEDAAKKQGVKIKITQHPESRFKKSAQKNEQRQPLLPNINRQQRRGLRRRQHNVNPYNMDNHQNQCLACECIERPARKSMRKLKHGTLYISFFNLVLYLVLTGGQIYLSKFTPQSSCLDKVYPNMEKSMRENVWFSGFVAGCIILAAILFLVLRICTKKIRNTLLLAYFCCFYLLSIKMIVFSIMNYSEFRALSQNFSSNKNYNELQVCIGTPFYIYYTYAPFLVEAWTGLTLMILLGKCFC